MTSFSAQTILSTILRYDRKVTSYKIALLRAINDVVLAFPDTESAGLAIAVPLRVLAERWVAYYWPFCDPKMPVLQGQRAQRNGVLREDLSFRPQLTLLRQEWETITGESSRPSDGYYLVNELRIARRREMLPLTLWQLYGSTLAAITDALLQPIQYAGPGEWSVFERPRRSRDLFGRTVAVPGTQPADRCLVISAELWATFQAMSLWVEALCLHEWALFTEAVQPQQNATIDRGSAYRLLTEWPENRRPLTWERNHVDLLIMEGRSFTCPWTGRVIDTPGDYALDHLIPIAVYPINELWNLVPSDARFNAHVKRDRLPTPERLTRAITPLEQTYALYGVSPALASSLRQDVAARFVAVSHGPDYPQAIAQAVAGFVRRIAAARNLPQFA